MTERPWPSRYGTLGEAIFGKDDPINDWTPADANKFFSSDEMPPTANPLNPKEIFTSKAALRQRYKEAGVDEVGTSYEHGYDPQVSLAKERERKFDENLHKRFKEHLNRGK